MRMVTNSNKDLLETLKRIKSDLELNYETSTYNYPNKLPQNFINLFDSSIYSSIHEYVNKIMYNWGEIFTQMDFLDVNNEHLIKRNLMFFKDKIVEFFKRDYGLNVLIKADEVRKEKKKIYVPVIISCGLFTIRFRLTKNKSRFKEIPIGYSVDLKTYCAITHLDLKIIHTNDYCIPFKLLSKYTNEEEFLNLLNYNYLQIPKKKLHYKINLKDHTPIFVFAETLKDSLEKNFKIFCYLIGNQFEFNLETLNNLRVSKGLNEVTLSILYEWLIDLLEGNILKLEREL